MQIVIDIPDKTYEYFAQGLRYEDDVEETIIAIVDGTPLPEDNKCKWIHYDYRTICPQNHDIDNPYWRIPENRMDALRYCPYCGKEIEIEADKESEV